MSNAMKVVPLVVLCALIIAMPSVWANWVQDGVALCTATGDQDHPAIMPDGAGGAIVTWEDNRSVSNWSIYAQRVNASGDVQWATDGVAICTAVGSQAGPQITSDGAGGAIITWVDYRAGVAPPDIYAQRVNALGAVQWPANGVAICAAAGIQTAPTVISDGAGGAIVTWMDHRIGSDYDIYAQKVNALGTVQWATDGVALCTATSNQRAPRSVSDGAGGAIVTWSDERDGTYGDIYAQRVNALGAVQWPANGVAICVAAELKVGHMIVSDGAGGAIITWEDESNFDIYAQRVNASGSVQWPANGVAICAAAGVQTAPMIVSDGAGGAIITYELDWGDDIYDVDIYAQKVDASGNVQWTTDGVAICADPEQQWCPDITSDGMGGAIVTWLYYRWWDGYAGIHAQRVNALGAAQWTVALCTAKPYGCSHRITSDGWGGAIVAWIDLRNGGYDIYALRVDANGFSPLTATDAPAAPIELRQNYPNPFNPTTTVTYSIAEKGNVTLKIYDISGKCIACLVDAQQEKGSYTAEWDGKDEKGNSVASGIYFYRLTAGDQLLSKKMVLLR